jgi:RNA polymerase sigma-70 factor, ECF subfamily
MTETELVALVRAGEANAFSGIVEQYQMPIIRYLFRLTGDYEMAQDLAQDTFVNAYKYILKNNNELSLKAWLYRIATNNALQHFRRKKFLTLIQLNGKERDTTAATSDLQDDASAVQEVLVRLSEEQRLYLVMHCVEGLTYREIGAALGVSEDSVRKCVARGKQSFIKVYNNGGKIK